LRNMAVRRDGPHGVGRRQGERLLRADERNVRRAYEEPATSDIEAYRTVGSTDWPTSTFASAATTSKMPPGFVSA